MIEVVGGMSSGSECWMSSNPTLHSDRRSSSDVYFSICIAIGKLDGPDFNNIFEQNYGYDTES